MSTSLLFISDTHVPHRARDIPAELWAAIGTADVVFHAGDWVSTGFLDRIEASAARLVGVHGNKDEDALRARLPEVARVVIEGIRFAVIHETGATAGREARCQAQFPDADVLVLGHSHIPWDTTTPRGLRLLNPGSPTDWRRQPAGTYLSAIAHEGVLREVTLVAVPPVGHGD